MRSSAARPPECSGSRCSRVGRLLLRSGGGVSRERLRPRSAAHAQHHTQHLTHLGGARRPGFRVLCSHRLVACRPRQQRPCLLPACIPCVQHTDTTEKHEPTTAWQEWPWILYLRIVSIVMRPFCCADTVLPAAGANCMPLYRSSTRPGCYGANSWHRSRADSSAVADSGAVSPCILGLHSACAAAKHASSGMCRLAAAAAAWALHWHRCLGLLQNARQIASILDRNSTVAMPAHDTVPDCLTG